MTANEPSPMTPDEVRRRVARVPFWWHSIDLGHGVVTPGRKSRKILQGEWDRLGLPDLAGTSVLDVGAWDGFFSFECERRGAARVVALDHFCWSMDLPGMFAYWDECRRTGVVAEPYDTLPEIWRPAELPGKAGFDAAREILGSRVEPVVADFMTADLDALGTFDIVLYLGVLYHMQDPLGALRRVARATRSFSVIETEAIVIPGLETVPLCEFYGSNELNADITNWWAPTESALLSLCRAAGFSRVEVLARPRAAGLSRTWRRLLKPGTPRHYRAFVRAWK